MCIRDRCTAEPWEAEPIKLALATLCLSYEECTYASLDEWEREAPDLVRFPKLPCLQHDGRCITHTIAILRYLGSNFSLQPEDDFTVLSDVLADQFRELRSELKTSYLTQELPDRRAIYLTRLPERMERYEMVARRKEHAWLAGTKITWVDFLAYDTLARIKQADPGFSASQPHLDNYLMSFEIQPEIRSYQESLETSHAN
eukprot:TRINITY_DN24235_c0_g1_i2.p1 TRINITY_DN24235_c0_g1~~TRINITY_DN24235_c0_g1_i2.p1  ORF type:complete len:201 (+),score=56.20 TRINITY_DN24235_c0_g1_i2:153-755(+)